MSPKAIKIQYWPILLVGIVGLIFSSLAYRHLSNSEYKAFKRSFVLDAQNRVAAIKRGVENVTGSVQVLASFYNASQSVDQMEFKVFAQGLLGNNPGIENLQWIPRIRDEGRESFPVSFVEPPALSDNLLGYDISTEPQRSAALFLARDSEQMVVSTRIAWPQNVSGNQDAFLVLKAIYQKADYRADINWRRENLEGFVGGMLRLSSIAEEALRFLKGREMAILIYDQFADNKDALIYEHWPGAFSKLQKNEILGQMKPGTKGVYFAQTITVLNKQWVVVCLPTFSYLALSHTWVPWGASVVITFISLVLMWYILVMIRRADDIKHEVNLATEHLQKVNQELERFAFHASHDMRAPLRGIVFFASFLNKEYKEKLDAKGQEYLNEIMQGTIRLRELIDSLLHLAQVSQVEHHYKAVNVKEIVDYVHKALEVDIKEGNVDLVLPKDWPTVICVRVKIQGILLNLMSNAVKFSSKNKEHRPRVELGWREAQDEYIFFVKDNGIGIAEEDHERIFGYFNRVHPNSEYEGSGIGLSIVKRAVEEHGGSVWLESKLKEGATFYFSLPKRQDKVYSLAKG